MTTVKKLRLLLWEECNRTCPYCVNQQWDLSALPKCRDFNGFDEVMLTGGEPMLHPERVLDVIRYIRKTVLAKIYVYTANVYDPLMALQVLAAADGITVTLHEPCDVSPFQLFAQATETFDRSKRVVVGPDVFLPSIPVGWLEKRIEKFVLDCPLPQGEIFRRW